MHRTLLVCTLLVAGAPISALTQDAAVTPGSRVRVWTEINDKGRRTGPRTTGRVTTWTKDSLVLDPAGAQGLRAIPITSVSRLDVSQGQTSRRQGALRIGATGWLVGLGTGAVLSYREDDNFIFPPVINAVARGAPVGAVGAVVGAILGANRPGERWSKRVPVPGRVSISPGGQNSVAVSAGFRF